MTRVKLAIVFPPGYIFHTRKKIIETYIHHDQDNPRSSHRTERKRNSRFRFVNRAVFTGYSTLMVSISQHEGRCSSGNSIFSNKGSQPKMQCSGSFRSSLFRATRPASYITTSVGPLAQRAVAKTTLRKLQNRTEAIALFPSGFLFFRLF